MTPRLLPARWAAPAALVVFVAAQLVAEGRWTPDGTYAWAHNNISDLGNVVCGAWDERQVCSPAHLVMNAGFVATGLLLLVALVAARPVWRDAGRPGAWWALALGATGFPLAGLFPADEALEWHLLGAALIFVAWPIGAMRSRVTVGSRGRGVPHGGVVAGVLSLAALACFALKVDLGLGPGSMERLIVYPVFAWLALTVGLTPAAAFARGPRCGNEVMWSVAQALPSRHGDRGTP